MKRLCLLLLLAVGSAFAASPEQDHATVVSVVSMQKSIDRQLAHLWPDEPYFVLGTTHGVYLDGYGAVFTAEVNLASAPVSPLMPVPTQARIDQHHQKKLDRLPLLEKAMREILVQTAASMDTLSDSDHVVIAVSLDQLFLGTHRTALPDHHASAEGRADGRAQRRNSTGQRHQGKGILVWLKRRPFS